VSTESLLEAISPFPSKYSASACSSCIVLSNSGRSNEFRMPRGKVLSSEEKTRMKALKDAGWSINRIAEDSNRSRTVVRNYLLNPDTYGTKKKKNRSKKVTAAAVRRLYRAASQSSKSCRQLRDSLDLPVTRQRVHQLLQQADHLVHSKKMGTPPLSKGHKDARLEWARKYVHLGPEWKNVIFSDEKRFCLDGPDSFQGYWRDKRKRTPLFLRRQNGGGGIMVWGAFSYEGLSTLAILEGNQDSTKYIQTLCFHLLKFNERFHGGTAIFQHDNASIHKSSMTTEWLANENIDVMRWPACSPDLNPIENLWSIMARVVYNEGRQYSSIKDLKEGVLRAWSFIEQTTIQNLVNSMTDRCAKVLEAQGEKITY
jgi:DDE superfamily endonuclease/Tc3 transposase